MSTKSKAFLVGINYISDQDSKLDGCINDVENMSKFLIQTIPNISCEVYTDLTTPSRTTYNGLLSLFVDIAVQSFTEELDFIWFHYSGHGSYVADTSGDELDKQDECIVPSDFRQSGYIVDDLLNVLFSKINPKTKVFCVFDCCHSGSIIDVKYSWDVQQACKLENISCQIKAKIATLSGCKDDQTSADAFNVTGDQKYSGAMTSCLLQTLKEQPDALSDIFKLYKLTSANLKAKRFGQVPRLCSTYNLLKAPSVINH